MNKSFSLVSTVFNEAKRLNQTICDIESQTLSPTEIIITDAGSTDGTYERLMQWQEESPIPIVILQEPGCNVAEGRNQAIAAATHNLIASTDFGCRFHPRWLESIITPFQETDIEVVGGAFSVREEDIQTMAAKADYLLQDGYPVHMDDYFSVSSRSIAYYKYLWERIGGYPEWLTLAADDTIFWKQVKKYGFHYQFVTEPYVYWERHKTLRGFAKEAYRYGLGDGESRINYRNFWSNLIETSLRYGLFLFLLLVLLTQNALFLAPAVPGLLGLRSYRNAFRRWLAHRSDKYDLSVFFYSLYLIEASRIQYLKGYITGLTTKTAEKLQGRTKLHAKLNR